MNHNWVKRSILLGIFIIALFFIYMLDLASYLTLEQIKLHKQYLTQLVENHYWYAVCMFIMIYICATTFALPGVAALSIAGGFLFGLFHGSLYTLTGATIGATLCFLITRYIIGSYMQKKYATQLTTFNQNFAKYGAFYLLSLRLIAAIPFFVVNVIAGLTNISIETFIITTIIGTIPGVLIFNFAGQELHKLESIEAIFSKRILFAFFLLALFSLIPVFYKRFSKK